MERSNLFTMSICILFSSKGFPYMEMKNYVPTIIFTVVITLKNVMGRNSEHRALFPWSAAGDIANNTLLPTYPPEYSYVGIAVIALIGFTAMILYFQKVDIH